MNALLQDLLFSFRGLRRSPGFTAAAVLCLALGIGANTAVFSLLNSVLLRPLPFRDPDRIVLIWGQMLANDLSQMPASGAEFLDYRDQTKSFSDVAAVVTRYVNLTGQDAPERLVAARVSASLFPLLGVDAALGRTFLPEEDRLGNEKVAVLSDGLWRRRFGGDPGIVGKKLMLSDQPFTVVGVMPPAFRLKIGAFDHELWIPIAINLESLPPRGFRGLDVVARLEPGISVEQANAEMDTVAANFQRDYPDVYTPDSGWGIDVVPLREQIVGNSRAALILLMGTVGLVLLIACANVANLLLARSTARQKEVAIRGALGASRSGLLRQFLTESLVLSLLGGACGLLLAYWGIRTVVALNPANLPRLNEVKIDGAVLGFTLLVSLLTGVLFGLVPALRAFKPDLQGTLKEGGKTSAQGAGQQRLRSALVVAEVAIALVVLVGAGLLVRSLWRLQEVDPGFETKNVLTFQVYLSPTKYQDGPQQAAYTQRLLESLRQVPGVKAAGAVTGLPLGEVQFLIEATLEQYSGAQAGEEATPTLDWRPITPGYLEALGVPLQQGRLFNDLDHAEAAQVAIVDETLVRRFWPGQNPIGRRLRLATGRPDGSDVWRTVVGVVGHVKALSLEGESREQVYTPLPQSPFPYVSMALRTSSDPLQVADAARKAIWAVDPDQPVDKVQPMAQIVQGAAAGRRSYAVLLAVFAVVALVLATVGVYGVMAYSVAQRHQEIGIRMALGARPADVLGLVVKQGLTLGGIGLALGAALSFWSGRWVESLLFGIGATDLATFLGVALLLGGVTLLASYLPARRAARVDPMVTFRS
jgi:putative ABC transport system permease protein